MKPGKISRPAPLLLVLILGSSTVHEADAYCSLKAQTAAAIAALGAGAEADIKNGIFVAKSADRNKILVAKDDLAVAQVTVPEGSGLGVYRSPYGLNIGPYPGQPISSEAQAQAGVAAGLYALGLPGCLFGGPAKSSP